MFVRIANEMNKLQIARQTVEFLKILSFHFTFKIKWLLIHRPIH